MTKGWCLLEMLVLILSLYPLASQADVVMQYGGSAGIGIRDCSIPPGCSDESALPPLHFQQVNGPDQKNIKIDTTGALAPYAGLATGSSGQPTFWQGSNAGPFGNPTIHATAYTADSRVTSGGWLLQSYTWDGTGSATRTASGTLTYSVSGGWASAGGGAIYVGMSIFTTGANTATLLESPGCGFGGLTFDLGATCIKDAHLLASNVATLNDATTDGTFDLGLPSITLDSPGETIFVLLALVGFTKQGGYTDASHTFVGSFGDYTGLLPAVTVPEPATLALLGLGFAGLALGRRRNRH